MNSEPITESSATEGKTGTAPLICCVGTLGPSSYRVSQYPTLASAVAAFEYDVYQQLGITASSVFIREGEQVITLGTWDANNGIQWSSSDRRGADLAKGSAQ